MPVTIDITQDLRYRQGEERGMERTAFIMLKEGFGMAATHKVTVLDMQLLEKIASQIQQDDSSSPKSNQHIYVPVTIDITQDLRYRQGFKAGIEKARQKERNEWPL